MADLSMVDIEQVVYSLHSGSSRLKKTAIVRGRGVNMAGPCPACHGKNRFYILPEAEDSKGQRRGKWACRNCHPKEGDAVALIMHMDGVSEAEAFKRLKEMYPEMSAARPSKNSPISLKTVQYRVKPLSENATAPGDVWQRRARQVWQSAIARLWDDTGLAARQYLMSRGLTEETIRAARLGYVPLAGDGRDIEDKASKWALDDRETLYIPSGILFAYEYKGDIWRLRVRRLGDVPKDERYSIIPGSSNGLYLADSIQVNRPCAMFEGEIDALSAHQCAGDNVSCVASGSTMHARIPAWTARLALASDVLLCFDNEAEVIKTSDALSYWTARLDNARVYPLPEAYHDVNDMLQKQGDVQAWILDGLRLAGAPERVSCVKTHSTNEVTQDIARLDEPDDEPSLYCFCGELVAHYEPDERERSGVKAYCEKHYRELESMQAYALAMRQGLDELTGSTWTARLFTKGSYTHDMRLAEVQSAEAEAERQKRADISTKRAKVRQKRGISPVKAS